MKLVTAACLLFFAPTSFAAKDDIVEFGGSRLVGELKHLDRGKLSFKTDATDTITIDWKDVTLLVSKQTVRVERRDGTRFFGTLVTPTEPGSIAVATIERRENVVMVDAVALNPIESTVWDRLDIDTSVGYAYTKATEVKQFNFNASFDYETEFRTRSLDLSSQSSSSSSEDESTRNVINFQTTRIRDNHRFTGWLTNYESNDALGLEFRFTGALIRGRSYFPSPDARIRGFGGIGVNEERFEGEDAQQSLEGVFGVALDWFKFSHPELDFNTTFVVLPSLTEVGRVRASLNSSLKWEIYDDLYWQLTFFDDFDTDARADSDQDDDEAKNDYGITTSLGWTW